MGDSGMGLTLSLDDSSVIDNDVMGLVDELEREEESLLAGTRFDSFVHKNVSCQTDFDSFGNSSLPLIFCGMISPECDAMTQCDIPLKVNASMSTSDVPLEPFPRILSPTKSVAKQPEASIKISVPMIKYGTRPPLLTQNRASLYVQNLQKIAPKPSNNLASFRPALPSVGKLSVSLHKGVNILDVDNFERSAGNSSEDTTTNNNTQNVTTFKEISPPSAKRKKPESSGGTEYEDESDSFSENEDLVIEEDEDAEDTDYWDDPAEVPIKKEAVVTHEALSSDVVDEQLMAVEECLKRIKTEPLDEPTETPIKIPKKTRMNLLQTVFQQNIKIEANEEWITDDEVDDDMDDASISQQMEKCMKDNDQRTCKECNLTFNSPLLLIEHVEANHVANVCNICGFTATFKNKLDRHMVKHTKEKSFICDICGKQYSQKQNLRDHISRNHSEEVSSNRYPFSCLHCKRMYRNESNLLKHQEQSGGKCDLCNEVFPCSGTFFQHKKNHVSCSCEHCDKVFQSRSALQIHVNLKHKDKGLQCSMCPKKFLFPSYLKLHFANAHSQHGPKYKCQECGFCAVTESYLKSHMTRMHSKKDRSKYMCQVCNKTFRSNARLVEHTRIHTGERPFACPVCFKTFYSQSNLYSHERTVHGRLNNYGSKDVSVDTEASSVMRKVFSSCYQCQSCSSTFNNKKKLKAHMASEHNIGALPGKEGETNGIVNNLSDLVVDDLPFEIDGETTLPSEEYGTSSKGEADPLQPLGNDNLTPRSTLSLPAYVVPPNVNLVEIDGVQYHVIRSNT